jgi:hypothetical protein
MGVATPRQHTAVVLRSRFNQLRALLAVALIAVAGLTVAVVILANDSEEVGSTSSAAKPIESINYGGFNPATGRPESAPLPQQSRAGSTRFDGGPEEGSADVTAAQPRVSQQQAFGERARLAALVNGHAAQANGAQSDGSSSQVGTKDYSKNGATSDYAHGPLPPDAPAKAQSTSSESQYGTGPYRFGRP